MRHQTNGAFCGLLRAMSGLNASIIILQFADLPVDFPADAGQGFMDEPGRRLDLLVEAQPDDAFPRGLIRSTGDGDALLLWEPALGFFQLHRRLLRFADGLFQPGVGQLILRESQEWLCFTLHSPPPLHSKSRPRVANGFPAP